VAFTQIDMNRNNSPLQIIIMMLRIQNKKIILRTAKDKYQVPYKGEVIILMRPEWNTENPGKHRNMYFKP
jgi:hypothetical protein